MTENKNKFNKQKREDIQGGVKSYLKYSGIGIQMVVIILGGVFGGQGVDKYFELENPIFTIVLTLLGLVIALYYMIKQLMN